MIILLKLKGVVGYKYVNCSAIKYFEPCQDDPTKTIIFFEDGTCLKVLVDAELIGEEIDEYLDSLNFGEPEEPESAEDGNKKVKH